MARNFDVSTVNAVTVEQVHAAFAEKRYWDDRLEAYGAGSIVLDSLVVDPDGTITLATTQDLRRGVLPGPLGKALPANLTIVRAETWHPISDGRVRGDVTITAAGISGSALGTADLDPAPEGSTLRFAGTVTVGVPLVGGQIEKFITAAIVKEIPGVGRFTSDWIVDNG